MPGLDLAKQRAAQISCANNLAHIAYAARQWSFENPGRQPQGFLDLTNILDTANLYCPSDSRDTTPSSWNDVSWDDISYTWLATNSASTVICACRVHTSTALMDGSVVRGDERPGWPSFIAHPVSRRVTPGSTVRLDFTIAPDALTPLQFQWRREEVAYRTNRIFVENSEGLGEWRDVRETYLIVTLLPNETNAVLQLDNLQTNHAGLYRVSASNELGRALSSHATVGILTDIPSAEEWSEGACLGNLRQISMLASLWANDHGDRRPAAFNEITNRYGLPGFVWPSILFCRSDLARTPPPNWTAFDFENTSYELVSGDAEDLFAISYRCKIHGYYAEMNGRVLSRPRLESTDLRSQSVELGLYLYAGRTNILESSPNLASWSQVSTFSNTNGPVPFIAPATEPHLFYRLRLLQHQPDQ